MHKTNPLIAANSDSFLKKTCQVITNASILLELLERVNQSVKQGIQILQQKAKAMVNQMESKMNFAFKKMNNVKGEDAALLESVS